MNEKITVISNTTGRVGVFAEELNFRRTWDRKGIKQKIDAELLEQLMNYDGVKNMFDSGILYIEDMDFKKEAGLEPEDTNEPVNIIILSDKEKERLLSVAPLWEMKKILATVTREEIENLIDYAIDNEVPINMDKNDLLKEITGRDILTAIKLNRLNLEQ